MNVLQGVCLGKPAAKPEPAPKALPEALAEAFATAIAKAFPSPFEGLMISGLLGFFGQVLTNIVDGFIAIF